MGNLGGFNVKDFAQLISSQIKAAKETTEDQAKQAGEQIGESFTEGIEQGLEDAASRITASSVKINKAFRDLAKRVAEQKISLDGSNIIVDFSKVDINSADFQKRINEVFEEVKIGGNIEFDSKANEKHFKNMLGLYIKYADKLSALNEQFYKPGLGASTKKQNAQTQLAIMGVMDEIQRRIDAAAGLHIELPLVVREDPKILQNTIDTIKNIEKSEEKVGKQRETNAKKQRQENKELTERNEILEQENKLLRENSAFVSGEGELPPARKPRARKPKVEMPVVTGTGDSALQQLKRDAEAASKAFHEAEQKLHNIYEAERKLDEQIERAGLVDYSARYQTAEKARDEALSSLRGGITKKRDHVVKEKQVRDVIAMLKDNGALSEEDLASITQAASEYSLTVGGKYAQTTKDQMDQMFARIFEKIDRGTLKRLQEYRNLGTRQEAELDFDGLIRKRRELTKEHEAAVKAYNDAADASSAAHAKFQDAENSVATEAAAAEKARMEEGIRLQEEVRRAEEARRTEEARAAKEREEAERRALELAKQKAEEEARIAAAKEQQIETYETDSGQLSMLPIDEIAKSRSRKVTSTANGRHGKFKVTKPGSVVSSTQMTIDDIVPPSIDATTPKVEAEAKVFDKVSRAADKASKSKRQFAKANQEVATGVSPSVDGLDAEADAMEKVSDVADKFKTRAGVGVLSGFGDEALNDLNLPVNYMGEKGQDAVQMFAKLKSEIEEMTGSPVTIDFISKVNDEGQLEAVGATLKYINEEAGVTVKQFYDIGRNQDGILIATQSHEKATLAAAKAAKVFNVEMQRKLALEQIKTLEGQMGELQLDLTEVKSAANAIDDNASLERFNLALRTAKEQAKQLKTELKGQNTLDTVASMERALLTLPSRLEEVHRRLNGLGDIEGVSDVRHVLNAIEEDYQKFLNSTKSADKVKIFRSLTSSMVWANAEIRNLSSKSAEIKKQETEVEKSELAKQRAARESYINWWTTTLDRQDQAEREETAKKNKAQAYINWWEKALKLQDEAERKRLETEQKNAKAAQKRKEEAPYLNYGKTTANSAGRKRDNLQGEIDALGVTNPEILSKMDQYRVKVQEILDIRAQFADDPEAAKDSALVKQFQKTAAEAERTRRGIKAVIDEEQKMLQMSSEQGFDPIELSADQIANLKNEMIVAAKATAQGRMEVKGWNDDHTKMYYTVTNSKGAVEEMTMALGQGRNVLYQYRTATQETGTLMQQIFKDIKVKAKELISFVIGGGSVYKVIELLRQGIRYVREIDLALTELKKVTDETEESYDRFLQTAAKTGARLGTTISAVTEATATFAKLGYSMEQATEMAEAAIVYKNVGDNIASTEDAADSIISTLKGFELEASETMGIVDKFNEVGNRFAITSQGIGEALRLSASALNEGGNSLDESIALITAANEVVNDPSSVGKNKLADIKSGYISQNPEVDKT